MKKRVSIAIVALAVTFAGPLAVPAASQLHESCTAVYAAAYYRTELYFGRWKPDNKGMVSDEEWEDFLLHVVTPRFPGGFTVIDAMGQYMEENDEVIKEKAKILVFLYPVKARTVARRRIEEIRLAYVKQFKQESVLRLDYPRSVKVTF